MFIITGKDHQPIRVDGLSALLFKGMRVKCALFRATTL